MNCEKFVCIDNSKEKTCSNCIYNSDAEFVGCPADWEEDSIICED